VFDCSGTHGDSTAKVRTLFNYPKRIRAMKAEVAEKGRGAKAEAGFGEKAKDGEFFRKELLNLYFQRSSV